MDRWKYISHIFSLILCSFLYLQSSWVLAQEVVNQMLMEMASAIEQRSYSGVFTYSRGDLLQTLQVYHRYEQGQEEERLVQLDGEQGEILKRGHSVVCLLPDNKQVTLAQSYLGATLNKALTRGLMPNEDYYAISKDKGSRVAGRSAVKLSLRAKDVYRYHFELWLDEETSLLLKAALLDVQGHVLELFQYSQIQIGGDIADAQFESDLQGKVKVAHEVPPLKTDVQDQNRVFSWQALWLPGGFLRLDEKTPEGRVMADSIQVYSDGMTSFSIYIEKTDDLIMPEGAATMGATVAYTHYLKWRGDDFIVMVVGEITPMAAMKVAESVTPRVR